MEEAGIIERVTGPTEWCATMVPVQKRNGKLRICVDLRKLNSAVNRARFVLPTLEDAASSLVLSTFPSLMQQVDPGKNPYIQIVLI